MADETLVEIKLDEAGEDDDGLGEMGEDDGPETNRDDPLEQSWMKLDFFNKSSELEKALTVEESCNLPKMPEDGPDFIIPELPEGERLTFRIMSTWGDPYYVGLNGIEIFGDDGKKPTVEKVSLEGAIDEQDVPEFAKLDNLVDDRYKTRDDTRLWWSRYSPGSPLSIHLKLSGPIKLAMIRVWNYNKSRIHATRGVRVLEIDLDDQCVFKGEISKVMGPRETDPEMLGDTILFTMREEILEAIRLNDTFLGDDEGERGEGEEEGEGSGDCNKLRPGTGDQRGNKKLIRQDQKAEPQAGSLLQMASLWQMLSMDGSNVVFKGSKLSFEFLHTWGHHEFLGLSRVQILGREGEELLLQKEMLRSSKPPTPEKLFSGHSLTKKPEEMWLCPWDGSPVRVDVIFGGVTDLSGFVFWNYNASLEMSYAGVKLMNVYLDDELILKGVPLRKAPGNLHYEFAQEIFFGDMLLNTPEPPVETAVAGFVFQIQLLSTWGDDFYVGLNGIQLYDPSGREISVTLKNLAAFPESVNILPNVVEDPRSSDKLIDGCNETDDPQHMWLAPVLPNQINRVYIIFDTPTPVGKIELWNYRKTPSRGGRDLLILVDDLILYDGEVDSAEMETKGKFTLDLSEALARES